MKIKLEKAAWSFDEGDPLGPKGGFGQVFRGIGASGPVAIKRLNISAVDSAYRELRIGAALASKTLQHVVPVHDYGQDTDSERYFLVMPICEESLQDKLRREGSLHWSAAQAIILDIIAGLEEVGDIVHRDLKPSNVLLHEGQWKIADFGIAKFIEESTSLKTLRDALTPAYAAPEQWSMQRPSPAIDVYAIGCIIHAIINGEPPFSGDLATVKDAHLHKSPPALKGVEPRISSLISSALRKAPEARPSLARCKRVIADAKPKERASHGALAEAGMRIAQQEAALEAQNRAAETQRTTREALVCEAIQALQALMGRLFDEIGQTSESVRRSHRAVSLGPAQLNYHDPVAVSGQNDPFQSGWDVAVASKIELSCSIERYSHHDPTTYTFSASLVFSRTPKDCEYRWREVSFWSFNSQSESTPYSVSPETREFWIALSNVVGMTSVAHGPLTFDAEDEETFIDRWIIMFAKAANGRLRNPGQMPPPPEFFKP